MSEAFFTGAYVQIRACPHVILVGESTLRRLDEISAVVQNGRPRTFTEVHEGKARFWDFDLRCGWSAC
jgi:hypothetical protein